MVRKSILLDLLNRRDWAQLQPLVDRFQSWQFYPLFVHAVEHLNLDVLYESKIHGLGHRANPMSRWDVCYGRAPV